MILMSILQEDKSSDSSAPVKVRSLVRTWALMIVGCMRKVSSRWRVTGENDY